MVSTPFVNENLPLMLTLRLYAEAQYPTRLHPNRCTPCSTSNSTAVLSLTLALKPDLIDVALELQARHDLPKRPALPKRVLTASPAASTLYIASSSAVSSRYTSFFPFGLIRHLRQCFLGRAVVREEIHTASSENLHATQPWALRFFSVFRLVQYE